MSILGRPSGLPRRGPESKLRSKYAGKAKGPDSGERMRSPESSPRALEIDDDEKSPDSFD